MSIFSKIPLINKIGNKGEAAKSYPSNYSVLQDIAGGSFYESVLYNRSITSVQAMKFYRESSSLATAIDLIADEVEKIKPVLLLENGDIETNHPILDAINKPNGPETRDEFIGQIARHYLLTHDSFVYAEGGVTTPPKSIWSVKPQAVTITEDGTDGYPQSYNLSTGMGRGNYKRVEKSGNAWEFNDGTLRQVYQIRGFSSSNNNTYSDSPLEAIALEIRQLINGRYHNLALLKNGARLSLVAIFKDQLDEEQLEARRQALNEHLGGSTNAGKIAVVNSEDLDMKEVGINNKDMDYLNLDKVASEAVARRYKIPLPLVSNDASTFNNLEKSVFHFYDFSVIPIFEKCYSGLGDMLMPRYGLDPSKNKITYNSLDIDALRMRKIEELSKQKTDGGITTNEYRNGIGREDVSGGDDILVSATLIPLGSESFSLDDIDDPEAVSKDGDK